MADVDHSILTGTELHEPKGIDSASANQIYLSNGSGSGTWTNISTYNPFGSKLLHIREQQASGVASSNVLTTATWNTVILNTEVTDELTVSISSNTVSLTSGTYYAKGLLPILLGGAAGRLKLYNNSSSADLILGPTFYGVNSGAGAKVITPLSFEGRFTLSSTRTISMRAYYGGTPITPPAASISSTVEVYGELYIWKLS